jgi:hypothetical protein
LPQKINHPQKTSIKKIMISTLENIAHPDTRTATRTTLLAQIDHLTAGFAREQQKLAETVAEMNAELAALRQRFLGRIRRAATAACRARVSLHAAIESVPELFARPRTRELHGVKVGFRKGLGGIAWDDDARVCELIEKHFAPAQADLLIKTTKKPIAKALADLDVSDLKHLGCRVESTGDMVVIAPANSDVEKLVKTLLAETEEATSGEGSKKAV